MFFCAKTGEVFHVYEDRSKEGCKFFGDFIPLNEIIVNFEAKSWSEHISNV